MGHSPSPHDLLNGEEKPNKKEGKKRKRASTLFVFAAAQNGEEKGVKALMKQ